MAFNYPSWNRIAFDRSRGTPLNEQLFEQLRCWIRDGVVASGARLPPSRVMAEELGLSRNTVVVAYERLATEGYVALRKGAGTFVENMLPENHHPRSDPARPLAPGSHVLPAPSRRGQALLDMDLPPERIATYDLSAGVPALNDFPMTSSPRSPVAAGASTPARTPATTIRTELRCLAVASRPISRRRRLSPVALSRSSLSGTLSRRRPLPVMSCWTAATSSWSRILPTFPKSQPWRLLHWRRFLSHSTMAASILRRPARPV